jgi:hypothetical protein
MENARRGPVADTRPRQIPGNATSLSGAPRARYGHSPVWNRRYEMIIWGGWIGFGFAAPFACASCWLVGRRTVRSRSRASDLRPPPTEVRSA